MRKKKSNRIKLHGIEYIVKGIKASFSFLLNNNTMNRTEKLVYSRALAETFTE